MIRSPIKQTAFKPKEPRPPAGPRKRKCKVCRSLFVPRSITHKACGQGCALVVAQDERKAQERKADRVRKQALKPLSDYAAAAQAAVNRYVNLRDRDKPCVSCGKPAAAGGVRNASHFKSVGSNSALRFHLWNIHSSCYRCNVQLSGNLGEYYPRLVERIGAEKVEFLQYAKRERRYTKEECQRVQQIFAKKAKRLQRRLEC